VALRGAALVYSGRGRRDEKLIKKSSPHPETKKKSLYKNPQVGKMEGPGTKKSAKKTKGKPSKKNLVYTGKWPARPYQPRQKMGKKRIKSKKRGDRTRKRQQEKLPHETKFNPGT